MTAKKNPLTSLRAYARERGVSVEAVSKAISSGRLRDSVVRIKGQPKIIDVELANREWEANTQPRADMPRPDAKQTPAADLDEVPDYNVSRAKREAAAARREVALADMAEIDVAEKRGDLVPIAQARADVIDRLTIVKTKILGVPTRLGQQLPHLASEVVPLAESLLRESLEELASELDDGDDDGNTEAA